MPTPFTFSKLAKYLNYKIHTMDNPCNLYRKQLKRAKETLDLLIIQKAEINLKLESKPYSASLNKDLRTVNMDIRITENEIEHAEYSINRCESELNTSK